MAPLAVTTFTVPGGEGGVCVYVCVWGGGVNIQVSCARFVTMTIL